MARALGLSLLLLLEQQRGSSPSDLATLYLLASIVSDGLFIARHHGTVLDAKTHRLVLVRCFAHGCLLALELQADSPAYSTLGMRLSPEKRHGILSRTLFIWVNPILTQGHSRILSDQDMPVLSQDMKPEYYRELMLRLWSQRGEPRQMTP